MSDTPLAPGYTVRALRMDDAEAVHDLTAASDLEEFGEAEGYTTEELKSDWSGIDLDKDAWLVIAPDGSVAGYATVRDRRHVRIDAEVYVHPGHFGKGIGTTLVRMTEERAREHVPLAPDGTRVVLHNWINGQNASACSLLEREGYIPVRYFLRMEMPLNGQIPEAEWPDGIEIRAFVSGEDERRFYETTEEAMADHWGHVPVSFDDWAKRRMGATFDPTLWFLASEDGEPAAAALCSAVEKIGWVDILAVRRPWRKRGLGMALLRHAAAEFTGRQLERMVLGVDSVNPTGATRLYERAGMKMTQQYATYSKELRAGNDLPDLDQE